MRASKSSGYESEGQTNSRVDSVPVITKENRQWHCRKKRQRHFYLHIKAKVLLFLKEEIKDKLPNKVRVQCVIDHFCPAKLEKKTQTRETLRTTKSTAIKSVCLFSNRESTFSKQSEKKSEKHCCFCCSACFASFSYKRTLYLSINSQAVLGKLL